MKTTITLPNRLSLVWGFSIVGIIAWLMVGSSIVQDPRYHQFADQRTLAHIRNCFNVISNAPFFAVAAYGFSLLRSKQRVQPAWRRAAYGLLTFSTAAVGIGSAYYHSNPTNGTLFWDRLPMTVVFISMLAIVVGERAGASTGHRILWYGTALGVASVVYWRVTGDLRLYAVVQFGPLLVLLLILLRFRRTAEGVDPLWWVLGLYGTAKLLEYYDIAIAQLLPTGGHPWKHVVAAAGLLVFLRRDLAAVSGARQNRWYGSAVHHFVHRGFDRTVPAIQTDCRPRDGAGHR